MTPKKVKIVEVGPRDGLQNEKNYISTDDKVRFIKDLSETGLNAIEVTGFVRSNKVPQFADSADVFSHVSSLNSKIDLVALVPNLKGLEVAKSCGVESIAVFTATSEKFNQKNINNTIDGSLKIVKEVTGEALKLGMKVRGYISTVFGCPYEGLKTAGNLKKITEQLLSMGVNEISFGDTVGYANPRVVNEKIDEILEVCDLEKMAMHFHDTYSLALSNVFASLEKGVSIFDSSAGGMGGCPYAKGASGNLATEDLVHLLNELKIECGVDNIKVQKASEKILNILEKKSLSKVHQALKKS